MSDCNHELRMHGFTAGRACARCGAGPCALGLQARPKRVVIGFAGRIGAGKTFAADHLVAKRGFTRLKFVTPLKDMLRAIGLTDRHIEGDLKEQPCDLLSGHTPRWAMQTLGTEWGRECMAEGFWTNLWRIRAEAINGPIVVDDVRFDNEAQAIRNLGGIVVLLRHDDARPALHASEALSFIADEHLFNDRTEMFLRAVDRLAERAGAV